MSFSSDVKEELAKVIEHNRCCQLAELTGFLITNCNIIKENREFTLRMATENELAVRRVYNDFKKIYGISPITNIDRVQCERENLYQLKITNKNDLEQIFKDCLINIDVSLNIVIDKPDIIKQKECCVRAFLRGLFIGAGSITDPNNMYHLEIVTNNMQNASFINEIINDLSINSKILKRKKEFVIYIKGAEHISNFLAMLGSNKGTLVFEETRVVKEVRNRVNRLNNFENANFDKTLDTAFSQIEDIKILKKNKKFAKLSHGLKEIANLRIANKDMTYEELGNLLEPKLSRAGVSHRFKKIKELADELRKN